MPDFRIRIRCYNWSTFGTFIELYLVMEDCMKQQFWSDTTLNFKEFLGIQSMLLSVDNIATTRLKHIIIEGSSLLNLSVKNVKPAKSKFHWWINFSSKLQSSLNFRQVVWIFQFKKILCLGMEWISLKSRAKILFWQSRYQWPTRLTITIMTVRIFISKYQNGYLRKFIVIQLLFGWVPCSSLMYDIIVHDGLISKQTRARNFKTNVQYNINGTYQAIDL